MDVDKVLHKRRDEHNKMDTYSEIDASPNRILGPMRLQIEAQDIYGLRF
jgi:hypothetical protein